MTVPIIKPQEIDKEEFLEKIMVEHGNDVLYLAYSYVKDRSIAEDLAQEVFLSAYTHLDGFNWQSSIKTWLYRITVNRCKDYLKSWNYRSTILSNVIDIAVGSREKDTEVLVIKKDEQAKLAELIFKLPLKYREVIYLFYFEEMSLNDMTLLLNQNVNTLKSRLKRAKEMLKKEITKGGLE
ncbi:sigma-70 family RNA polymerase sigma factor [Bacillus sp. CGMCC 1.16607]|uniref:sigma-70 family RNA polymerase sigma factor n=1 Tax=Bacillus sp. CGMCC 1.16607 TaxID=3351842 RepID=UPI00363C75AB